MTWSGELLHIHVSPAASVEMEELPEAKLIPGKGIEGDRYLLGTGTYSAKPDIREVTLIEMEVLEALAIGEPKVPAPRRRSTRPTTAATSRPAACR